jgi:hypothetical protein
MDGWLSTGFGIPNPRPTTYLIALPLGLVMWLFGPLVGLMLLAGGIGYLCMRCTADASAHWGNAAPVALGTGFFALFNPWVYNEVVAGHLVMVLAYGGLIGLFTEMLRGRSASQVRLALWIALIEAQLQFYIVAMLALVVFAFETKKWRPLAAGAIFALPSIIGLAADRATLLQIPYVVTWQTNQSIAPLALLDLGGYFPGYADRLGVPASIAVWVALALALGGAIVWRTRVAVWTALAALLTYVVMLGIHGPLAVPYAWIVRTVPESGVFRELYDLGGVLAALIVLLACAVTRVRWIGYVSLAVGVALPVTWLLHPPSDLWIGSTSYPHPVVASAPFTRVALMPAFQPLGLRSGGGDGADPDTYGYPGHVSALNEYFPTYPVDMALARYEQTGNVAPLRALGVSEIVPRPWMVSQTHGEIGLAASSLASRAQGGTALRPRYLRGSISLISECESRVVAFADRPGTCAVFFGDLPGYSDVVAVRAPRDSIDARTAWIDARLAFAEAPSLAQAIGGALTQSTVPLEVEPGSWLLAYVRGSLDAAGGRSLARSDGTFAWLRVPPTVTAVRCAGLCELIARANSVPNVPFDATNVRTDALEFRELQPWLYVVRYDARTLRTGLLRLNERYDPAWIAVARGRLLAHVRVDLSVNGWYAGNAPDRIILVQVTSVFQLIAEAIGILCALWLLKALARAPTKRAR